MANTPPTDTLPHDLGGMPGAEIDRSEHELAYWERRIEATLYFCFKHGLMKDAAELRRGIELLSPNV